MSTEKQSQNTHSCSNSQGWDYVISVAGQQIQAAEEKIKQLKFSIQTFKEMQAKGEPFPVEEANKDLEE
jgi:hypothetical protein